VNKFITPSFQETLTGEFLTRKRGRDSQRQLVGDLIKCRKVCEDLDLRYIGSK